MKSGVCRADSRMPRNKTPPFPRNTLSPALRGFFFGSLARGLPDRKWQTAPTRAVLNSSDSVPTGCRASSARITYMSGLSAPKSAPRPWQALVLDRGSVVVP